MKQPTDEPIRLALVQQKNCQDPQTNLDATLQKIREAKSQGARIVCLQELFATGYFCQEECEENFQLAESISGEFDGILSQTAAQHEIVLIAPFFERRAPGLYHNSALIYDSDGSHAGLYRKMHIPDDPQFYEKYYFAPGDLGFSAFDTHFGRIGVGICWDQWFPEAARLFSLAGAQILFYPTAIGWIPGDPPAVRRAQHDAWETMQRSHAIANGCFVVAANRVGKETSPNGDEIEFWGQSFVANPAGEIIAKASDRNEEVLVTTVDLAGIEAQRIAWPFLRDRRIDSYSELTRRYRDAGI